MKGALGLIAISLVVWGFWMTWEWLRKPSNPSRRRNNNKNSKQ